VPGHTCDSFPDEVAVMVADGHELAHHSYNHVAPADLSPDAEQRDLAALAKFGVTPKGYALLSILIKPCFCSRCTALCMT